MKADLGGSAGSPDRYRQGLYADRPSLLYFHPPLQLTLFLSIFFPLFLEGLNAFESLWINIYPPLYQFARFFPIDLACNLFLYF